MPLYRKIPHEMTLQKAENFVSAPGYEINAATAKAGDTLPDGWKYYASDADAVTGLAWPLSVPTYIENPVEATAYVAGVAIQEYIQAFANLHGYLPSLDMYLPPRATNDPA